MIRRKGKVYIPSNLDFNKLLRENPPTDGFKPNKDKVYYFVSQILSLFPLQQSMRLEYGDYTYLNAHQLKKAIGNEVKSLIHWLISSNVIESDGYYIKGLKSKGYRLTAYYANALPCERIIMKSSIVVKLYKESEKARKTKRKFPKLYKHIKCLEIDVEGAKNCAYEKFRDTIDAYPEELRLYKLKKSKLKYKTKSLLKPTNPYLRLASDLCQIEKLRVKHFTFIQDDTSGRLHTNLTSIRSDLRSYITSSGTELASVDFANSQPLLSCALFNEEFWGIGRDKYPNEAENLDKSISLGSNPLLNNSGRFKCKYLAPSICNDVINDIKQYFNSPTSIMIPKRLGAREKTTNVGYMELCEKGGLYELLKQKALNESSARMVLSKQQVKAQVFQVLFTSNKFIGQPEAEPKRIFGAMFPRVYELLAKVKKKYSPNLPILLQKIESKLILERIVTRIEQEKPFLKIYTIHDSVASPIGTELYVQSVMKEEMQKALGLNATTRIEYWTKANTDTLHNEETQTA